MDLIKTVRGLDQNGPGDDGENIQLLWRHLAASADTQFHAAEESSLRWLLKLMNGRNPAAETMRRYPLSWTILECIFRRMPLLSLAKSLAFRKFIAVLQQTVTDLATPTDDETRTKTGKRKRESTIKYELENLKTTQSRLQATEAVFNALRALLRRLDSSSSHDKIGAEHVRSLFCTSAADMIKIVNPLFILCGLALDSTGAEPLESSEEWISDITAVWDLHLQGEGDANEVAAHLLGDVLLLVTRLDCIEGAGYPNDVQRRWNSDTHTFLLRVVTQPAKAAYVSQQNQAIVAITLDINRKRLDPIAPALYRALSASSISSEVRRRKGETEWMENALQVIEEAVRPIQGRENLLKSLLKRAAEKSMPVKVEHLRFVCQDYALKDQTHWDILALAVACDADIFQVTESGKSLLASVCSKMLVEDEVKGETYASMNLVVEGILKGFRISRDIPGFLRLWYTQMCEAEGTSSPLQYPWFHIGQSKGEHSLSASIEQQMSPQQLIDVLNWVVEHGIHQQSLSVFLAGVSQGVKSHSFADVVCDKLFELSQLAEDSKSNSWAIALRWATLSRSLAWFPSEKRTQVWTSMQKSLSKVLKKGDIESANCFEAFKCCCQAWSSLSPDDPRLSEPLALLQAFSKRLITQISEKGLPSLPAGVDLSTCIEYSFADGPELVQYIAWYSRGHPRLVHLSMGEKEANPLIPEVAVKLAAHNLDPSQSMWEALVDNDQMWQNVALTSDAVGRLTGALKDSTKGEGLPFSRSHKLLHLLSKVPSDAFTRQQREALMAVLIGGSPVPSNGAKDKTCLDDWKRLLSIILKLATRPTFYEGMQLEHLINITDGICRHVLSGNPDDDTFLEMIERTTEISTTMFRQMSENVDDRSVTYLCEGAALLSAASEQAASLDERPAHIATLPLRLTLMKSLITQLSHYTNCTSNEKLAALCTQAQKSLSEIVAALINRWVNEKSSRRESVMVFALYSALDAAHSTPTEVDLTLLKSSKLRKLDASSYESMMEGDLRGWTIQIFLRTYLPESVSEPLPNFLPPLDKIPGKLRETVMARMMVAVSKDLTLTEKFGYACSLIANIADGTDGCHGQVMAVDKLVRQITKVEQTQAATNASIFPMIYGELIRCLPRITNQADSSRLCRVLQQLLEMSPRPLGQWNIELTLEQLCDLSSQHSESVALPYTGLCKIVEVVIKKHRLRLEGHYHLLTTLLQALLCKLVGAANSVEHKGPKAQAALAQSYARIITLICEPTVGAVSRGQQQGSLSSATDTAKRSAGKHMYLVLMQYVKLQLEGGVARPVRETLEPAMNSIFDVTSPEGRKILNDAMNASGRAILREMFKRYTKFGKWSGV